MLDLKFVRENADRIQEKLTRYHELLTTNWRIPMRVGFHPIAG